MLKKIPFILPKYINCWMPHQFTKRKFLYSRHIAAWYVQWNFAHFSSGTQLMFYSNMVRHQTFHLHPSSAKTISLAFPSIARNVFLHVIWIWDHEGEWYCSCALGDSRSKPHIFPCDPIFFNSKHYHDVHCIQSLLDHGPSTKGGKRSKQSYSSPLISGQ